MATQNQQGADPNESALQQIATGANKKDTTVGPIYQVRDLTGGVNLQPSPTNIKPEQARRLVNTNVANRGELGVYPGYLAYMTSLGNRRMQGGKRIYLTSGIFTLIADNGNIYKPSDAGVAGTSKYALLSTTNQVDFVYDRDTVAAFDGTNVPQHSADGITWYQFGISEPLAVPTLAAAAGGALVNGDTYGVAYAYQSSTFFQNGNITDEATQAVSGGNLTVNATVVASTDPQVTNILVFARDQTAGESVLRLQGTYANVNAVIPITSNNWDAQDEAPTDHMVSLPMAFGTVWKNRWWGRDATVKNRLRFSQIFQALSWPDTFFVDIPLERGEGITAVLALGDTLVVFGYTRFYLIVGTTSLDFQVQPSLGGQSGAFGFRAVDTLQNGIVHASGPGVYLFNGAYDQLLSFEIDPAWRNFVASSTQTELAALPLVYHQIPKELRIGVPRLYPTSGRGEWLLSLNRSNVGQTIGITSSYTQVEGPVWFATDRPIGGYIQWDGDEVSGSDQGRIFSWSPTTASLVEERVGQTANGAYMQAEYDGYMLPLGLQVGRVIDTYIEYQPATGFITVDLKVDGLLMGTQTVSLGGGLTKYGSAIYGVSRYGGGADRNMLSIMWPITAEGRTAQLLVKYVGTGDFKLFSYGHNVFAEPVPRGI